MMAGGAKITDVAKAVGIHRSGIYRWLRDPDYASRLRHEVQKHHAVMHNAIVGLADQASIVFENLLSARRPSTRLKAASEALKLYQRS